MLQVTNLAIGYGRSPVLGGISFSLKRGERMAIIGKNGTGKTTLLKTIAGLLKPLGGEIIFDGSKRLWEAHQRPISFVPTGGLFPWLTVERNVRYRLHREAIQQGEIEERLQEVIALVRLPADSLGKYPKMLSAGQCRRAELATGLVSLKERSLLLWDEPFANLDRFVIPELLDVFPEALKKLRATVLVVTHELSHAEALAERQFDLDLVTESSHV